MLSKIKALLALIAGVILIGWRIFVGGKKSAKAEIKAQAEETAKDYREAGYEAYIAGTQNEQKIKDEKPNTSAVDHFS